MVICNLGLAVQIDLFLQIGYIEDIIIKLINTHLLSGYMNLTDLGYKNLLYADIISQILIALIILLVGLTIGRVIGKIVLRVLNELNLNFIIKKTTKLKISIEKIISDFIKYLIYFATFTMTLTQLGLPTTTLNILMAAVILIFLIISFFIINYFLPNIIAGIFIKQKGFIKEKDNIKLGDKQGTIMSINLIETTIRTKKGESIYIPNSILAKKEITKLKR